MISRLSVYIAEYKKYLLVVPFFIFLDVLGELSMPLLMAKIIDVGIPGKDVTYITQVGVLMVLLAFLAIGCGIINMKYTSVGALGFGANLRNALFKKVQSFSFTNIDKFSTASLVTRLTNDVNNLQMTLMMGMRILLRAPMMLLVGLILAYSINAELSLILAIAIPVLGVSVWAILNTAVKRFSVMQGKIDAINHTLQENLIAIREVKSFVRADHEVQKFKRSNDDLTASAIKAVSIAILNMPVMMLVMDVAILVIIWLGGGMVSAGTMGAGALISFISYVFQILFSVMMLSFFFLMSARAQASGNRVLEVLDTQVDIFDKPVVPTAEREQAMHGGAAVPLADLMASKEISIGRVDYRHVSFKYSLSGSGENVLSDINFSVLPGEVIGIVGGTGTGKSTLVSLIPRLYDVTEGSVLIDDIDVRDYPLETLRKAIGVVLQKNTLFSGTIRENLLWGNENVTAEELDRVCRDAQAYDFIASFPQGYETELGQGGVNVSGGQKQRLCIARAMLKQPKILILDNSTSAVDSDTESNIRQSFYQNLEKTTVIIIAQRISSVRDADKILVLDDGTLVGIGTHQELMQSNTVYQEINASQQEGVFANE